MIILMVVVAAIYTGLMLASCNIIWTRKDNNNFYEYRGDGVR